MHTWNKKKQIKQLQAVAHIKIARAHTTYIDWKNAEVIKVTKEMVSVLNHWMKVSSPTVW